METTDPLEIVINFRFLLHCFKDIVVDRGALWPYIFIFKNRLKNTFFNSRPRSAAQGFDIKMAKFPL